MTVLNTDSVADSTGYLNDTRVTGLGMGPDRVIGGKTYAGAVTYSDLELVRIDLGRGNDRLLVDTTHGGVTVVNAGPGNDQIHVRNVAGPTTVNGEDGNDRISVGTSFDAAAFGAVIDHVNAAPGGTIDRIRALLRVDGGAGADTVNVDDSGDPTSDVAIITGSTVDGLDLATSPVVTVSIAHAIGGTYTLTINGSTTAPLAYAASPAAVKAAILALHLAERHRRRREPGGRHLYHRLRRRRAAARRPGRRGRLRPRGRSHRPPVSIAVAGSAESLSQIVDVHAAGGTFTVAVGAASRPSSSRSARPRISSATRSSQRIRSDALAPISGEGIADRRQGRPRRQGRGRLPRHLPRPAARHARRPVRPQRAAALAPSPAPTSR